MLYGYRQLKACIKTEYIYKAVSKYVNNRFDITNYKLEYPLPNGNSRWENKKAIELMNWNKYNERGCWIMRKNVQLFE